MAALVKPTTQSDVGLENQVSAIELKPLNHRGWISTDGGKNFFKPTATQLNIASQNEYQIYLGRKPITVVPTDALPHRLTETLPSRITANLMTTGEAEAYNLVRPKGLEGSPQNRGGCEPAP